MPEVKFAIVGGGPVGLLLAYDLGRRGLPVTLYDNARPTLLRKAGSANIRSMEHLRRFGLAKDIQAAFPPFPGHHLDIVFATGFVGHEIHRFERALGWDATPYSNEVTQIIPQKTLAKVVRRKIEKTLPNVEIRDGTKVTKVYQSEDSASLSYQIGDEPIEHDASFDYVIGCDGGSGITRKQIGAKLQGEGSTARNLRVLFSAPWLYLVSNIRIGQQLWLVSDKTNASFAWGRGYQDNDWIAMTIWRVSPELEAEVRVDPEAYLRNALGFDLPFDVISVDGWDTHNLVSDRYRKGRVFLAGDAVHLHPPTGGLGLNTGIGDVADLGWKLAAVAQGWGGPVLLDSYEVERRTAALRVVSQANHNYRSGAPGDYYETGISQDGPEGDAIRMRVKQRIIREKQNEFYSPGLVLGTAYETSPVIIADAEPAPETTVVEYSQTAKPGHRLPHSITPSGKPIFAELIEGITLVTVGGYDRAEVEKAAQVAETMNIPFAHVVLNETSRALYRGRYLFVRPDHYVVWRSDEPAADWRQLLSKVTGLVP